MILVAVSFFVLISECNSLFISSNKNRVFARRLRDEATPELFAAGCNNTTPAIARDLIRPTSQVPFGGDADRVPLPVVGIPAYHDVTEARNLHFCFQAKRRK